MIPRIAEHLICKNLFKKKAILLFGARQVGKTTLLENLKCLKTPETLFLNGDEADIKTLLTHPTSTRLQHTFAGYEIVVIDEAQEIEHIGTTLKIITDKLKNIQVIATGSSAFELANRANEPLTGRKFEFMLFPISYAEMVNHHGFLTENRLLEVRLIFGYYPEIVNHQGQERDYLKLITNSYLYKDLLRLEKIKRSSLLQKILEALALQMGGEVSYNELAQLCGTDNKTVLRYIDLLQKAYIIFELKAYSKNIRNEIKKKKKIYFWDNGIRNAIITSYKTPFALRQDKGALWENFIVNERKKRHSYENSETHCFFLRTTQQKEID